jgi:hypothetical protein
MLIRLVTLFFFEIGAGCLIFLPVIRREDIGNGFYKFILGMSGIFILLALAMNQMGMDKSPATVGYWLTLFLIIPSFLILLMKNSSFLDRALKFLLAISIVSASASVFFDGYLLENLGITAATLEEKIWFVLNFFTSTLVLGSIIMAMLVGHWYLVKWGLPLKPLRILAGSFIIVVALKTIFMAISIWSGYSSDLSHYITFVDNLFGLKSIFFWMRVLWGLAGPLFLSYLIWETVKIRSTQSATGIIYVAVFFILVGELLSKYLVITQKVPL